MWNGHLKGDQISDLISREEGARAITTKDATDDDRGRQEEDGEEGDGLTGKHWRRGEDIGLRASRPVVRRGPLSMA